jgi:hypothetical protein
VLYDWLINPGRQQLNSTHPSNLESDAAEAGVMVVEADSQEHSVGLAGHPDAEGIVTLDAAIMDATGRAGGVAFVRGIVHPIAVARLVMERTPHVLLVGEGAEKFASTQGIARIADTRHPDVEEVRQYGYTLWDRLINCLFVMLHPPARRRTKRGNRLARDFVRGLMSRMTRQAIKGIMTQLEW